MKDHKPLILAIASLLAGWQISSAAITVVNPTGGNHIPKSVCPAKDGSNKLNPDPATYLPPPATGATILNELTGGDTAFPGWTFQTGTALKGTLTINYYKSTFLKAHRSGADIKATYTRATNDPTTLRWVQMVETSDPMTGATSPYIDPYPSDDPTNATALPFYWTEKETKAHGNVFSDFSKRTHPPTSAVTWRGHLYLSSWDGNNPGTVTIHDGIKWGFDAGCAAATTNAKPAVTKKSGDKADIAWSTDTGLLPSQLETTSSILDPNSWLPVLTSPTISNGHYHVEVDTTQTQEFYRVAFTVTNSPGIIQPADFRFQPQSGVVTQGWELFLSVKADGDPPHSYQWYHDGEPLPDGTGRELSIPHAQFTDQGNYTVSVTNAAGGEISTAAFITVVPDTNAPALESVFIPAPQQVLVVFSEPIDPISLQNPGDFQIQQIAPPGPIAIDNVMPGPQPNTAVLTLSPSSMLQPATSYELTVTGGGCDFADPPNCIPPGSSIVFTTP